MTKQYPVLIVRGGIYEDTLSAIDDRLSGMSGDRIYLVIDSPGGNPTIGYRIMRMLQAKYSEIIAVVPGQAYSTATLMVLGTDIIYMQESACLGPLDIQVKHPTDGTMISTLEIREVLNTLAGSVKTYAEDFFESLKNNVQLGKKDAAELSMKAATEIVRPVVEKIDPIYLQSSVRTSRIGQKYAENLLLSRMMKDSPELARLVSVHLANNYDYHGYAITPDEAHNLLALNVLDVSILNGWDFIKILFKSNTADGVHLHVIDLDEEDSGDVEPGNTDDIPAFTGPEEQAPDVKTTSAAATISVPASESSPRKRGRPSKVNAANGKIDLVGAHE